MKILIAIESVLLDDNNQPLKNAIEKMNKWVEQGAEIFYLTSAVKFTEVKAAKDDLKNANFPGDAVQARREGESFAEVILNVKPEILIVPENAVELTADSGIPPIIVKAGNGIELLPDSLDDLKYFGKKEEIAKE